MSSVTEEICGNLRAYKARREMTAQQLGDRMAARGFTSWRFHQTVSAALRGQRRISVEELVALAEVLDTTVAHLMEPEVA